MVQPRKRGIDTVKDYLKKIGLNFRQAKRMMYDRGEFAAVFEGGMCGTYPGG